jgi:HEAT repeat protein
MRQRLLLVAAVVSLVLVATAAAVLRRSPTAPAAASDQPAAPAPFAFRWPAGTVWTYALEFDVHGAVAPANSDQSLSTSLALAGELALRSYGRLDGKGDHVLGARLVRLTKLDWTLGAQPVLPDGGRSLVGPELAVVVGPDGKFRSLDVALDDPHLLVNLLRGVLGALEVVVSPGRSWTALQTNPVGDVRVLYEVRADEPSRLGLYRRPVQYTRLAAGTALGDVRTDVAGGFEVVLTRAGHLDRVDGEEKVSVERADGELALRQDMRIEARLLSISQVAPGSTATARLAGLSSTGLGDVTSSPESGRRLLEQRAGDLTMDRLVQDLLRYGSAPDFPDTARWMWRATGLLLLYPERCRDLLRVFKSPRMNQLARGRVLELLASAGSPEAQAVACELLETREARGSDRYAGFVQRLSLVEHPTQETVDYLRAQVERGDGESTLAAAHALGAALGNRSRTPGAAVDERSAALLRQGLRAASSAQQKVGWLGTLGNAGLAEDVPLLAGYATDGDPAVRGAAAHALRKTQTPASEKVLLGLVADTDSGVRDRALQTLTYYTLSPAHLDGLRQQAASGRLQPGNIAILLTVLERNRHQPTAVLPVLEALLRQDISDRRLLLRIRALREALASGR